MVSINDPHQTQSRSQTPNQLGSVGGGVPTGRQSPQHPLDASQLNHSPATIPPAPSSHASTTTTIPAAGSSTSVVSPSTVSYASPEPTLDTSVVSPTAPLDPTVAETGVPISAGATGPGPARGSLLGGRVTGHGEQQQQQSYVGGFKVDAPSPAGTRSAASGFPSAEEEKRRLAAGSSGGVAAAAAPPPSAGTGGQYETAEDEKKRLERAERDRLLGAGASPTDSRGEEGQGHAGPPPSYE